MCVFFCCVEIICCGNPFVLKQRIMFVTILIKREKGCVFIQIDVIMFLTTSYDTAIPGKGAVAPVSNENKAPGGDTAVSVYRASAGVAGEVDPNESNTGACTTEATAVPVAVPLAGAAPAAL